MVKQCVAENFRLKRKRGIVGILNELVKNLINTFIVSETKLKVSPITLHFTCVGVLYQDKGQKTRIKDTQTEEGLQNQYNCHKCIRS